MDLKKYIRSIPDYPKKGILFRAHGTLDYTIKEGVNKNKIADEKILKSKK